jgi:hypothetical protein
MNKIRNFLLAIIKILTLWLAVLIGGVLVVKTINGKENPHWKKVTFILWAIILCNLIYRKL